jgi:hypothetical protein
VRLLTFSLYGDLPLYCRGAVRNAELAPSVYPGWTVRFYVDGTVPLGVVAELGALGCEIVMGDRSPGPEYGKFWRFAAAADASIERFVSRDADSRLNPREKAAVDAWIASGATFHVMRDSIYHRRRVLGGMWGGLGGSVPDMQDRIDAWDRYERWGESDAFLSQEIWPLMAGNCVCHDSWGHFGPIEPFPPHAPLDGTSYVGEIVPVDGPPFDVWREVGVLRDRVVCLQAQLEERSAEVAALRTEAAAREERGAREPAVMNSLWRRLIARLDRRP